jgi:hypothetical protein
LVEIGVAIVGPDDAEADAPAGIAGDAADDPGVDVEAGRPLGAPEAGAAIG